MSASVDQYMYSFSLLLLRGSLSMYYSKGGPAKKRLGSAD